MKKGLSVLLSMAAAITLLASCEKDNLLVGTLWKCEQDSSVLIFQDNSTGSYLWYEDENVENYNFTYSYSKGEIGLEVTFPRRIFNPSGVVEGDTMHLGGDVSPLDYVKMKQ